MRLLIDGNNAAYRANVTTDLRTKSGEKVSAIYGVLNMINGYLKKSSGGWKNKILEAVHEAKLDRTLTFNEVVVCWDGGKSKFRKEIFPDYKGHREKKKAEKSPEEKETYFQFLDQMETLHEILPTFGVKSIKAKGWEADDLLYAASKLVETDELSIVVSTDRDMLQLVSEKVYVWSPYKEILYTPENFAKLTGVPKKAYLTYRILVGDKSDNIEGIYGIGEKKAKDLIIKYGDLGGILANQDKLMKSVVTRRILENPEILDRNNKLMNMEKIPFEDIKDVILATLKEDVAFEPNLAKAFLMSKQMVSILKDFGSWSIAFNNLNK